LTVYAVLLRGINVGGINIKMADLRATLSEAPLSDVQTLLASGNVVCRFDGPTKELKPLVEARLRERFGYEAWVIVLEATQLAKIAEACPFLAESRDLHAYVTFATEAAALDALVEELVAAEPETDRVRLDPEAIAYQTPVGQTLTTPGAKVLAKARYKSTTTTRNLRTLLKVVEAARKLD